MERRKAGDGKTYTHEEFLRYYGEHGEQEWEKALSWWGQAALVVLSLLMYIICDTNEPSVPGPGGKLIGGGAH